MQIYIAKKTLYKKIMLFLMVLFLSSVFVNAQSNYTEKELDTLVSNIALYPDPLLVHVLTASTYGEQIPSASAWSQGHKNLRGESLSEAMENDNLPYDPSVQALLPFPTVLQMMSNYRTWCDQLGDAVTNQKDDVMNAIQRMREKAYNLGHLRTDEQVEVLKKSSNIEIQPVKTEIIYVPVYNPRVVYYVNADGYRHISYGTGVWLGTWYGEWGWGSCWFDWGPRVIYVRNTRWYAHRPIPHHPRRYRPQSHPRHEPRKVPQQEVLRPRHSSSQINSPRFESETIRLRPPLNEISNGSIKDSPRNPPRVSSPPISNRNEENSSYENNGERKNQGQSARTIPSKNHEERKSPRQSVNSGGFGKVIRR